MDTEAKPDLMDSDAEGDVMLNGEPEFDESAACFTLGEYRDDDLLTKAGMAKIFKCTFRTLQRMVERFEIPPPTPFAGRSIWIVGRLKTWVASAAEAREAEAMKQAKRIHKL